MTVFTCEESFEAMMTCIYDAWASGIGHERLRLQLEPVAQEELFCSYIHVEADVQKAEKVARSVLKKISPEAYRQMFLAAMSFEPDRLDAIYRFLVLGFAVGAKLTDLLFRPEVAWILELSRKAGNEANFFREFTRFTQVGPVYTAHIEPKCNVTAIAAEHFADRMPSEHWMIVDDKRRIAAVHPADHAFYMTRLSEEELRRLCRTEEQSDLYTDLWEEFFRSIAIDARKNEKCQRGHMPLWYRKHMTEFRQKRGV